MILEMKEVNWKKGESGLTTLGNVITCIYAVSNL